jgi:imidazolonepropionase-like amidohydrolase
VRGGLVRYVGSRAGLKVPGNARRIDMIGKTILPGLIDVHTHLGNGLPTRDGVPLPPGGLIEVNANRYLYYGITHVLSLGLDGEAMDAYIREQAAGRTPGARVYFAGLGLSAPGGWSANRSLYRPSTAAEAREAVRAQAVRRVNAIKFWVDDDHGKLPKLSPEIYGAIIDEAHRHNLKAFCHEFSLEDAKQLMRSNLDVLAHSVRDKEIDEEFVRLAITHHTTMIPTLVGHSSVYTFATRPPFLDDRGVALLFSSQSIDTAGDKATQEAVAKNPNVPIVRREVAIAMKNVKIADAAGVQIALGTDTGPGMVFGGLADHVEMQMLVESGLTPMRALQIATINGARVLGVDRDYGSISPGKRADFVVLNANPLIDIRNTRGIEAVWVSGQPVDRAALATGTATPLSH